MIKTPVKIALGPNELTQELQPAIYDSNGILVTRQMMVEYINTTAKRMVELEADAGRLNAIASEYFTLEPFDIPTFADDADVGWRVLQHHCGELRPRMIAEVYRDEMREVIDLAMKGGNQCEPST